MLTHRGDEAEGTLPLKILKPILESIPRGELFAPTNRIGMDAAIIKSQGQYIIIVSGSRRGYGKNLAFKLILELAEKARYAGARPRLIAPIVLFPKGMPVKEIKHVVSEIITAASKLGITVAKGHTEITPWLDKMTIVATVIGTSNKPPTVAKGRQRNVLKK